MISYFHLHSCSIYQSISDSVSTLPFFDLLLHLVIIIAQRIHIILKTYSLILLIAIALAMRRPQPYVDRQAMREEALQQALNDDYQIKPIMINTRQHYDQDDDYYITNKQRRGEYEKHEFYDAKPESEKKAKSKAKPQSEVEGLRDELQEAQDEINEAEKDEAAEEQVHNEETPEAQAEEAAPAEETPVADETPGEEAPAEETPAEPAEEGEPEPEPQAEEQCEGEEQAHEECLEEECTKETIEKGEEEPKKKKKKEKPKPRPKIEDYSDAELGRLVRLRFSRQRHPIRRTFEDSSTNRPTRTNTMNNVDDVCFYAYEECNYAGRAIRLCGRFPTIPPQLSRMVVRSLQIPRHTRIEFYSHNNYGGEMQSFIGSNRCLVNPFTLNNLVRH